MNFELTEEQQLIAKTAREFATATLAPRAAERDRESLFPEAELHQLGALGLLGVNVPDELGGAQAGAVSYSLALTEIAAADASVAVAMAVTNMVAELIVAFGSDEQKRQYVPRLCSGEAVCGAFALEREGDTVRSVRLAFGGMAAIVRRAAAAEAALAGKPWSEANLRAAMAALESDFRPLSDMRASAGYRMKVAQRLLLRLWHETRAEAPLDAAQTSVWSVGPRSPASV